MQRFRQRWKLSLGRLPTKDHLPIDTMQAMVRTLVSKNTTGSKGGVPFWGRFGPPHNAK